ncbi:MAG TPA: hypothetical protein VF743_03520, partial [Acidimicrobiales bacterium]
MTRLWKHGKKDERGAPSAPWPAPAIGEPGVDGLPAGGELVPARYEARPVRPWAQLAVKVGLWTAVVLGCLGGLVALVGPPAEDPEPVVQQSVDQGVVPAPVAGVAELVTEAWLTADEDDRDRLDVLFVDHPALRGTNTADLRVTRTTTVAGKHMAAGYWAVTVEADVVETIEPEHDDEEPEERQAAWYVQVGIVGNVNGGLAALTTPAVVPPPPHATSQWQASATSPDAPAADDPVAAATQGFLDALLAGDGDPSRYMAAGVTADPADPAPFEQIEVAEIAVDDLGDGRIRIYANALATTPGGASQYFTYELIASRRVDRWEIESYSGAPTLVLGVEAPEGEPGAPGGPTAGGTGRTP